MAGSFNHIVSNDGKFTMGHIENLGDAYEALEECFILIYKLSGGDSSRISEVCKECGFPDPWDNKYGDDPKEPMSLR